MSPEQIVAELRHRYDRLTPSQKRIAEAILEDPEFVAFATVDKLADRVGVSPSTIVRFAYRLQLDGYPELQERIRRLVRAQLRRDGGDARRERSATAHLGDGAFAQSLAGDLESLERTIRELSTEQIDRAVEALLDARRVRIAGAAASRGVAGYAVTVLGAVRPDVTSMGEGEQAMASLLDMTGDDALLALAFAPYSAETLRAVTSAQELGAMAIAIADNPISPVGRRADILLAAIGATAGRPALSAATAVVNALAEGVAARSPEARARHRRSMELLHRSGIILPEPDGDR